MIDTANIEKVREFLNTLKNSYVLFNYVIDEENKYIYISLNGSILNTKKDIESLEKLIFGILKDKDCIFCIFNRVSYVDIQKYDNDNNDDTFYIKTKNDIFIE